MRVATFNVLHGRSPADGSVDAGRLAAAVTSLDAEILGLQEVDRDQERSGRLHLAGIAAEAMGARDWRFAPALVGVPGLSWRPATGDETEGEAAYGVALLSRLPVRSWHVVRLPAHHHDEPRVALAAVVDTGRGEMTVATTHLSYVPGRNVRQLRRLVRGLRRLPGPHVLAGDLNLPGRMPALVSGWRRLAAHHTFPANAPRVQLDHVLGHGRLPPVVGSDAPALGLSDHRALVVELAG